MKFLKEIALYAGRRPIGLVLLICLTISTTVLIRHRWREDNWKRIVESDGCGYYAYLPAVFIYQDLQYRFYLDLDKKYQFGDLSTNFLYTQNGRFYNKYFCGTAIVEAPFFLLACLVSALTGNDIDGHSFIFHAFVNIGAICYSLLGLFVLSRYLLRHFHARTVAIVCGAIFLGTNLFNYAVYESSYSHAYSFSFICFFIWLADRSIRYRTRASYIWIALCASLVVLIRPSNATVILSIPFIAGSWSSFVQWITGGLRFSFALPAVVVGIAPVCIQSLLYFFQCGSWWVDGYPYERFYLDDPHILQALFSYRAGAFLYSPVLWIAIPGLYIMLKNGRYAFFTFSSFMFATLWIMSSWWAWYYAGTFGMRPMVDYMGFAAIPLCMTIAEVKRKIVKSGILVMLTSLLLFGQVLNFQIIRNILPHDLMTSNKYWYIFLKTTPQFSYDLDPPYHPEIPRPLDKIMVKHFEFAAIEGQQPPVFPQFNPSETFQYEGTGNSDLIKMKIGSQIDGNQYYGELKVRVKYPSLYTSAEVFICFVRDGEIIETHSMPVICPAYEPDKWQDVRLSFISKTDLLPTDEVLIRINNGMKYKVWFQEMIFTLATY